VIRVWQLPVESLLTGGLGLVPLALITDEATNQLPEVVRRMDERLAAEAAPEERRTLWTTAFLLMGLRHPPGIAAELLRGVREMEESSTYQWIIEKGMEKGMEKGRQEGRQEGMVKGGLRASRKNLVDLGTRRFRSPTAAALERLNAIDDPERLDRMINRLLDAADWDDLLGTP